MIQILTLWYLQHDSDTYTLVFTTWFWNTKWFRYLYFGIYNMILEHQMIQILTLWYIYLQHDSGTPNDSDTYTLVFTTHRHKCLCYNMILEHQMIHKLTIWYLQHDSGTPQLKGLTLSLLQLKYMLFPHCLYPSSSLLKPQQPICKNKH